MFTIILIVAVLLIVALVVLVNMQPADFRVTRSRSIPAPASVLFEQVDVLQNWGPWSPFDRADPNSKRTFAGPASGVGATCSWEGPKSGAGSMTTIESRPNELVRFDLHFLKPFKADNIAEFTFKPEGNATVVTWSMTGKNNFFAKAFGLVINCDKMCGDMFASGLKNMEEVVTQTVTA